MHVVLYLGHDGRPYRGVEILGSARQELGHEVQDDQEAGIGLSKEEVDVDEVRNKDDMMQKQGTNIGQRHALLSSECPSSRVPECTTSGAK